MGLETAHPAALDRLNKRFTLTEFERAARALSRRGVALRVFLLISPPFVAAGEQDDWLLRSVDAAFGCGASVIALVPTRSGNGTMEALAEAGLFRGPDLDDIERSFALALGHADGRGRVFVDCWDLDRFASCASCITERRDRLHAHEPAPADVAAGVVPALLGGRPHMTLAPSIRIDTDVAIIGSGFGGSLTALALRARGQRVALIERGRHPRFAIGESSTPLANLLLEELAARYDLPQVRPFCKWGSWQRLRPDVACGLKRGFTFLLSSARTAVRRHGRSPPAAARRRQPARCDRRHALVPAAVRSGAGGGGTTRRCGIPRRHAARGACRHHGDRSILDGEREGRPVRVSARFVIDASGPRGISPSRAAPRGDASSLAAADAGALHALRGVERWDRLTPASSRLRIRSMMPRCTTSSPAVGFGCSASTTASRALVRR